MGLVVFSLFMYALLLAWMPPDAIRRVFARPPARLPKIEVRFHAADPRQRRAAAVTYAADVWDQTEMVPVNSDDGTVPVQVVAGGEMATGVSAACRLVRNLGLSQSMAWLLCPLLRLPGIRSMVGNLFGGRDGTAPVTAEDRKRQKPVMTR
jgi:hypothetical protein